MTLDLKQFEKVLLKLLVFLLPTQLALHFWPKWSFVFGIRVDYLSPAIYLTDILLLLLLSVWIAKDHSEFYKIIRKVWIWIFVVILFASLNIIFSVSLFPTMYRWAKIFETVTFALYVSSRKKFFVQWKIYRTIFISVVFFSLIGVAQTFLGHTIGGLFYFLGERNFNLSTPGIALETLFGQNFLRPYSTFSHPNSLAGYFSVCLILLVPYIFRKKNLFKISGFLIILTSIIFASSLASFLGLFGSAILYLIYRARFLNNKNIFLIPLSAFLISILLSVFSYQPFFYKLNFSQRFLQRMELASIAGQMVSQKFWIGEGLNTFTIKETKFIGIKSYEWILQPVHNIYLLAFSETGIIGLIFLLFVFYKAFKNAFSKKKISLLVTIVFILITGLFDHYWLTLQQNLLLFGFVVGLSI